MHCSIWTFYIQLVYKIKYFLQKWLKFSLVDKRDSTPNKYFHNSKHELLLAKSIFSRFCLDGLSLKRKIYLNDKQHRNRNKTMKNIKFMIFWVKICIQSFSNFYLGPSTAGKSCESWGVCTCLQRIISFRITLDAL